MERPRLLWVRALNGCESKVARALADEYFSVTESPSVRLAPIWAQRVASQVVCWEFEEAQALQLRAMRDFKVAHPSIPLLMLTTQHSEELAVWAFRARVWNYLVKPVAASELRANFNTMAQMVLDNRGPPRSVRFVRALLPNDVDSNQESPRVLSVKAAVEQVERHFAEKLRQTTVAASCGMSSCRFSRAFKAAYGLTFSEYLIRFRINRACQLLRQGSHSATGAGLAVGFEDPSHFARAFRKLLGISPSSYQRQKPPLGSLLERRRLQPTNRTRALQIPNRRAPQLATLLQANPVGADTERNLAVTG
jgi:AraC-like DNA-binding protein